MHPVTLEIMNERIKARRAVENCSRCGGSGKFATVTSEAQGSHYGQHCFKCGHAYKVPRTWTMMNVAEINALFPESHSIQEKHHFIRQLQSVRLLSVEQVNELSELIKSS
ncbi:hypothetical protein [Pseudoalteromonas tetraodonis]|uniref:hypothetical protein n=1 Tax=Pseudoalteromonas tetraodonis TaxID=43659 RepID=UPI000849C148|nr:hypothetical protein [Pseudoalteromonas tetraodonis]ODS15080.1 hypothetical protein BCD66_00295 [Pseudoalteromonas tetraodonis]